MLHQIGAGVLGPVFRAYQPDPGRLVAVKQFRIDLPPDSAHRFVAALDRLIAADLTHSGIAAPLAAGLESLTPFLALDFVAADSFDVVMRDHGPAPAAEALRVATQLAGALDFAAAAHVYHGSLHPRDVLVSAEDTRITGLGIAQALESIGQAAPIRRPYTAPERVAGASWDRRADVFSTAALIYEMLFGRRIAGIGDAASEAITAVEGVDPDALRTLFARALAERPDDRFDTVLAFAEALHVVLGPATQATRAARSRRKRETNGAAARRMPTPTLPLEPDLPLALAAADLPLVVEPEPQPVMLERAVQVPEADLPLTNVSGPVAPHVFSDVELTASAHARYTDVDDVPARTAPDDVSVARLDAVPEPLPRSEEQTETQEPASDLREPAADAPVEHSMNTRPPRVETPVELSPSFGSAALEESRSAVWPIALALVVGLAVGFALGYGTGTRERVSSGTIAASATSSVPVAEAPAPIERVPSATTAPAASPTPTPVPAPGAVESASPQPTPVAPVVTPEPQRPAAPPQQAEAAPSTGPAPAARAPGRIAVRSTPAGARVTVDGRDAGVTPTTVRELGVGTHVVRIAHQGYVAAERRVRIRTAQTAQSIEVDLVALRPARQAAAPAGAPERTSGLPADARGAKAGSLMVDSRPAGARVFVDGKLVGTTPLLLDSVDAGEHAVRLELDGFRVWTAGTKVTGGERARVSGSLEQR